LIIGTERQGYPNVVIIGTERQGYQNVVIIGITKNDHSTAAQGLF
jgi:hypothetical protein